MMVLAFELGLMLIINSIDGDNHDKRKQEDAYKQKY